MHTFAGLVLVVFIGLWISMKWVCTHLQISLEWRHMLWIKTSLVGQLERPSALEQLGTIVNGCYITKTRLKFSAKFICDARKKWTLWYCHQQIGYSIALGGSYRAFGREKSPTLPLSCLHTVCACAWVWVWVCVCMHVYKWVMCVLVWSAPVTVSITLVHTNTPIVLLLLCVMR